MKNARIYGRFSSKPQERGDSKRMQIDGAKEFAKRNSYNIVADPYFDEAVSGKAGANLEKEFGRLLKEANEGETILVQFMDRLGRQNPFVLGKLLYDTTKRGISIHAWDENKLITPENIDDFSTQISTFTGAAVGNQENRRKMKRLRQTTDEGYKNGEKGIQSGTLVKYLPQCYTWNKEKKKIEIDEAKAEPIKKIFEMFNSGIGKTSIVSRLNEAGYATPYKAGKQTRGKKAWLETSVKKILKNESYAGVLNVKGHKITCIPKVVEQTVFDKAQVLLARHAKRRGNHLPGSRANTLFGSICVCKYCGGKINVNISVARKKGWKRSYFYRCKLAKTKMCHATKFLAADLVELSFFDKFFGGSPRNAMVGDNKETQEKLEALRNKLAKVNAAIQNLYDMAEAGDNEAKDRIAKRKIEREEIGAEIMQVKSTITEDEALPTAINVIDDLLGTKEGRQAIFDYFPNMQKALADNAVRKQLVNALPSIFSKVEFDVINRKLEAFDKQGRSLGAVKIDGIYEAIEEIEEWKKETEQK